MSQHKMYSIDDVFLPSYTGGSTQNSVRHALNCPEPFQASSVAERDRAAQELGTTYGMADAGWDDVQTEVKVQNASRVPHADKWVAEAPENVAFLNEDADGLLSVYDSLMENGILGEEGIDRETVEDIARDGNGLLKALQRGRINNLRTDLGQRYLKGEITADEARAEVERLNGELAAAQGNDPIGFFRAVEQFYRMGTRDLPNIAYRGLEGALMGASAGAIAGTVIPGAGNIAGAGGGAVAGLSAGAARGAFETSQQMEEANFVLDLLMEKDDAGQYLDEYTVKEYARAYGMVSAFVEIAGDAAAMKILSPVLKTVGAALRKSASTVAKDAIRAAMKDKSLAPVVGRLVRGVGAGALAEGTEEAVQQGISEQLETMAKNALNDAGVNYYREEQKGLLGSEAWSGILESGIEGAKMGMWFHLLPGVTKFALDTQSVLRAQEFADANRAAAQKIEASKTQQLSPVRMESFLKTQGLNQTVLIPADVAWQMQSGGVDLAGAFGWEVRDLEEAAALKHDIAVPLARLHTIPVPAESRNALFDVMREQPSAMSAMEAVDGSVLAEDVDAVNAAAEEWEYQQDRLDMELDRVRAQITEAVRSAPELMRQLTTSADTETSVGMYVDSVMKLIRNAADRLSVYGADADSILDRLHIQGLIRDAESGRMVDPNEMEQLAADRAQAEADAPFWENVWGRLDAASLKRDFPEARKELASIHGRGLFAPRKGEGIAVDQLADELKTAGWLPEDADLSTLIEMLKEKRRPAGNRGGVGVRLNQAMAQSQADSLESFIEGARKGRIEFWRSSKKPEALNGMLDTDDIVINIPYSFVRHLDNRRREQTDRIVNQVEDVFSSADYVVKTGEKKGKPLYSAVKINGDGTSTLIVFEHNKGRRGNRVLPYSGIIESSEAVDAVVRQKERASTSTGAGGNSSSPKSLSENEARVLEALTEDSMPERVTESNTLFQTAYHGTPHRFDDKDIQVLNTFYQGQNSLAERFAGMPMIEADSSLWFGPGKAIDANRRDMRKAVQTWSKTRFPQGLAFHNQDRGWDVQVSPRGITKTLSHGFDETLARSIPFIPQIVESGIYIADGKIEHGMQTHIFANKINLDGHEYVVGFVVREDQNGRRFYDHELTEIIDPGSLNAASLSKDGEEHATRANRGDVMNILRDRLGVNDGTGQILFQPQETGIASQVYATASGSITPRDGSYYIQLFRGANLSTLAHETMHAVHLEMEQLEREGKGTPELKKDLDALRSWTSRMDDDSNLKAEYDRYQRGQFGGKKFSELTAEEKAVSRGIAKQEMVARGFEAYLREGVSPSRGMEGVFRRFGKWLMRVYRQATMLDVELTDDVRRVFDSLVASDEDIRAAAAASNIREESSQLMDALGLEGAERLELESMIRDAEDKASDALRRDRNRVIRERAKEWTEQANEEIAHDPVYQARALMRKTPVDMDSVTDVYGQDMADRLARKLPASMKRGGVNPEEVAFAYGFRNAGEMIRAILDKPGVRERRAGLISQKRRDAEAQFAAEDYLFEQEELAQKEERIGKALYRMELRGETVNGRPVTPSAEDWQDFGRGAVARVEREQIRTQAEKILESKTADANVRPDRYRRAVSKAIREERFAIMSGDWAAAIEANYRVRINLELAHISAERRKLVEKLQRQSKRFVLTDKADTGARFGVFVLAVKTGLFNPTTKMLANAGDKTFEDVQSFLDRMKEAGLYTADAAIDDDLFRGDSTPWREQTWEKLRPYLEATATMMHMERSYRKANSEAAREEWRAYMDEITKSILIHNTHREPEGFRKKNIIIKKLEEIHASHLKADTICRLLDGDEENGPAWRAIIAPINRATWERAERMKKERDAIRKLYSVYNPEEWVDIRGKRYFVDALGESITKEQALAVLLNAGNGSNLQRLMTGNKLTEAQVQAVIDTLDERDVKFAQAVWDYLDSFRKESFDLEEQISGVRPKAIEATPVKTKFGVLRGGYYPVVYDKEKSSLPIDTESIGTVTGSMFPAVDHGSMKSRTALGAGTALALDLEAVPRHVVKTVHMLSFRKPVQQVARVLNDRAVMGAIEATAGVAQGKALKSWLHYVAGERPASTGWSRALGMLRKNSALYSMGIKLTTILAQTTGLLASTAEIGPRWVACGISRTYAGHNPFMVYRETAALSPMMANRMQSIDRDLYEISTGLMEKGSRHRVLDPLVRLQKGYERTAFLPMGFVQMTFCDLPTWQGAYARALHEGKSQEQAIEYADAVVERTQVGGAEKDLAAVQRGHELGKIMTQFYSYFSALYQLYTRRITMLKRKGITDKEAVGRLATLFLLTGVVEPVLSALVTGDTPDDDEDWLVWGARKAFFNPFNMVIGLRDLTGALESRIEGYGGRARVGSLINDVIDTGIRFGSQLEKGLDMDPHKAFDAGWKLTGLLTGTVNAQELLLVDAFWDWLDGTNPDFELADLIRKKK